MLIVHILPNRHQVWAFYTFCVEPCLGQCCQHWHFNDLVWLLPAACTVS